MKVLLVIPKKRARAILPAPDIGVAYVGRAGLDVGAEVEVLDAHKDGIGPEEFGNFIKGKGYDLVGFKCLSTDLFSVVEYCKAVKNKTPSVMTVVGGPHPTALPEMTLAFSQIDYIIRGEGEKGFASLLRRWMEYDGQIPTDRMAEIPNLAYRNGNGKTVCNPMVFPEDLDNLGFPAWQLFDIKSYPELPGSGGRFLPLITSRGCPSNCTFCCSNSMHGKRIRTRSPEHVIREIEWLISKYDIQKASIFDNNFTYHKSHVTKFCQLYRDRKIPIPFDIPQGIRINKIDEDVLEELSLAGCDYVGIGVESGEQRTLDRVRKGTRIENIKEKLSLLDRFPNIRTTGFFIIGFPDEKKHEIWKTLNFALELPLDHATFTIFTPFPGTELFDDMEKEGYFRLDDFNWENLLLDRTTFEHRHMSHKKLKMLQRAAYIKFYFRLSKIPFFLRIVFKEHSFASYLTRFCSILRE